MDPNLFGPSVSGSEPSPIPYGASQLLAQGNAALAGGITSGVSDLSKGVQNWKQLQLQSKAADYMIKSYDQKDPATGAPVNPILDQMGVHPDQWSTMGAREKVAAVQGIMQGRSAQAQSQELQAKTGDIQAQAAARMMQTNQDSALSKLAPRISQWAAQNPGKPVTPAVILQNMQGVNMNPREQAVMLRSMMGTMTGGDASQNPMTPTPWKSPAGNNYVTYGREIMQDRAPFDPSSVMGAGGQPGAGGTATGGGAGVPPGYSAVPDGKGGIRYLQEPKPPAAKTMSPAMQGLLMKHLDDFNDATDRLQTPDDALQASGLDPKTIKASLGTRQKTALKNGQTLIDTQFKLGNINADERDQFYQSFGITPPAAAKNAGTGGAPGTGSGASGAGDVGDRIPVWKGGKQFTVPKAQKDAAVQQGYSLAPAAQ